MSPDSFGSRAAALSRSAFALAAVVWAAVGCNSTASPCRTVNCSSPPDMTFQICSTSGSSLVTETFDGMSCQFDTANQSSASSVACANAVAAWCASGTAGGSGGGNAGGVGGGSGGGGAGGAGGGSGGGSGGGAGGGSGGGSGGGAGGGSGGGTITGISCGATESFNTSNGGNCGSWRWTVKTGQDAAVDPVLTQAPTPIDIKTLGALPVPSGLGTSLPRSAQENTLYILKNVTVVETKLESDSDYHMPLTDPATGAQMEAEIPFPPCATSSAATYCYITHGRHTLESIITPTGSYQSVNKTATIIGPAFFDMLHGSASAAPNGIEIHPVLAICFGQDCDPLAD